jgi:Outer membrane receptor for Fe3+-dicitrate
VKGTNISATTNADGQYSITLPANANTLVFSYVGYQANEVSVQGNNVANSIMQVTTNSMNEVVVIGYGVSKRRDVTGAVSSVTASQIEKVPVTTLDQALQGRAAGVQIINNDATPGGNVTVLIRGVGSLAPGGNAPLYVVDGYPTTGGINNINP